MRTFSDFEKEIIKIITHNKDLHYEYDGKSYVSNSLGKIMVDNLDIIHLKIQDDNDEINKIEIVFKGNDTSYSKLNKLFEFVFLIKYLENNYSLGLSPLGDNSVNEFTSHRYSRFDLEDFAKQVGAKIINKEDKEPENWCERKNDKKTVLFTCTHIHTTSLAIDILRYAYSMYYPTQRLKYIAEHDFKSYEWEHIEKQTKYARRSVRLAMITLFVAAITLFTSIALNNYGGSTQNQNNPKSKGAVQLNTHPSK